MANFCSQCGSSVNESMTFCPSCGAALHKSTANTSTTYADTTADYTAQNQSSGLDAGSMAVGAIGTLVAVNLLGGLTQNLYFHRGRYYLDPYCRRPFGNPHLILGRRLLRPPLFGPRPPLFGPRPPMGGPRPPMGGPHPPMGGPRGPMGGPRGGGPRGRR